MMADASKVRRFPRVGVAGRIEGDVSPVIVGSVIDLSLGGACIEHREILRPGWTCKLTLRENGGANLTLQARVIWTKIERMERRGQDRALVHRAGVEFVEVTADQAAALQRILKAGGADGPGRLRTLAVLLSIL